MSRLVKKVGNDGFTTLKRVNRVKKKGVRIGLNSKVTSVYNDFEYLSSESDSSDYDFRTRRAKVDMSDVQTSDKIDYTTPQIGIRLDLPKEPEPPKKKKHIPAPEDQELGFDDFDMSGRGKGKKKKKKKPKKQKDVPDEQELENIIIKYLLSRPSNIPHESIIGICHAALPEGKTWKRYYSKLPKYKKYKKFNDFVRTLDGDRCKVEEDNGTLILWKTEPWKKMDADRKKRAAKKQRQKKRKQGILSKDGQDSASGKSSGCGCCGMLAMLVLLLALIVGVFLQTQHISFEELVSMLNERARSNDTIRGVLDDVTPLLSEALAQLSVRVEAVVLSLKAFNPNIEHD